MKYVIILEELGDGVSRTHHMIFPDHMVHFHVAMGYMAAFKSETGKLLSVVSGGTCYQDEEESDPWWICERKSDSLQIPRGTPEDDSTDAVVLNRFESFNGLIY